MYRVYGKILVESNVTWCSKQTVESIHGTQFSILSRLFDRTCKLQLELPEFVERCAVEPASGCNRNTMSGTARGISWVYVVFDSNSQDRTAIPPENTIRVRR